MDNLNFKETIVSEYIIDAMIKAPNKAGLTRQQLLDVFTTDGLMGVYTLGLKHIYEYLKGDNNETL